MSTRAKYTGHDGLVIVCDQPLKSGQVVALEGGDITASAETIAELLERADFERDGAPADEIDAEAPPTEPGAHPAPLKPKKKR